MPDEKDSRSLIRREYWTYALDLINQVQPGGSFRNIRPSKGNFTNGYFGINGFCICCIARSKGARVEIYLCNTDRSKNKRAYDLLFPHKAEIESLLDVAQCWDRGDKRISSKISLSLGNVSIEHKADWPQMAQFHAKWSKKFDEVIVPCLTRQFLS